MLDLDATELVTRRAAPTLHLIDSDRPSALYRSRRWHSESAGRKLERGSPTQAVCWVDGIDVSPPIVDPGLPRHSGH